MESLLVEKYRSKTVDDYVFKSEIVKQKVDEFIEKKELPNLLLTGSPGTGKSTLIQMLIEACEIDRSDVLYVDCSTVGMDFIRETLIPWVKKAPMSNFRVVHLEEMDRFRADTQKALRVVTEEYSDTVRFVATANYQSQIIPALHSRFQHFHIDALPYEEIIRVVCNIVESEEIRLNDEADLLAHIEAHQPDLRKIINSISQYTINGVLHAPEVGSGSVDMDRWREIWMSGKASDHLEELLQLTAHVDEVNKDWFYETMYTHHNNFKNPMEGVVTISKYISRSSSNHRIHLDAFLYEMFVLTVPNE